MGKRISKAERAEIVAEARKAAQQAVDDNWTAEDASTCARHACTYRKSDYPKEHALFVAAFKGEMWALLGETEEEATERYNREFREGWTASPERHVGCRGRGS